MGDGGDDAVFQEVAGGEAEDADGFDTDILIGGGIDDGRVGIVGDGAGKNIDCAAAGGGDADKWGVDGFEGAVVGEIEAGELAETKLAGYFEAGVGFLAAVAAGFKEKLRFRH